MSLLGLAALASSHGLVQKPATRQPGDTTGAACGKTMETFCQIYNKSYLEALLRANPKGLTDGYDPKKCNLWLCRGYQFADNAAQVQSYKPGDVVDMEVYIRIPHKGYANVSGVDTAANAVIGEPLTVPELGVKCTTPGACVIQWYWLGQGQTYESCIGCCASYSGPQSQMKLQLTPIV